MNEFGIFLFYVTLSTSGYSEIHVVPMQSMNICEQVKTHMLSNMSTDRTPSPLNPYTSIMTPFKPECRVFKDTEHSKD